MLIAPLNESMNSEFSSISTLNEFRSDTYSTQSDCDEAFILRKCKSILQMDTIYLSPSMYLNQLGRLNEAKGLFVKNSSQIVYKMVVSSGMREKLHMIVYNRIPDFRNNGHSLIPNNSLEQFSEREKNRQVNKKTLGSKFPNGNPKMKGKEDGKEKSSNILFMGSHGQGTQQFCHIGIEA